MVDGVANAAANKHHHHLVCVSGECSVGLLGVVNLDSTARARHLPRFFFWGGGLHAVTRVVIFAGLPPCLYTTHSRHHRWILVALPLIIVFVAAPLAVWL